MVYAFRTQIPTLLRIGRRSKLRKLRLTDYEVYRIKDGRGQPLRGVHLRSPHSPHLRLGQVCVWGKCAFAASMRQVQVSQRPTPSEKAADGFEGCRAMGFQPNYRSHLKRDLLNLHAKEHLLWVFPLVCLWEPR
jgi:hypothetical protein